MKNVTITLDPDTARWVRVQAAERELSVSRFVGEVLRERRTHTERYQAAMRRYLAAEPIAFRQPGEAVPTRAERYDRAVFRR